MQKARLTRFYWLVVLAALILGCAAPAILPTPTSLPTQPPPTSTPIPPTDTPTPTPAPTDTPAPTATPAPTKSLSSIANALVPAAEGNGVAEAAAYDPNRKGIHPMVFIVGVDQNKWNNSLPAAWKPSNVEQAELVAVLLFTNVPIDKTRYYFRGQKTDVWRFRVDTEVVLREAKTGNKIATTKFEGNEPPAFPPSLPFGQQGVYGSPVYFEVMQLWLITFVEK